MHFVHIHAPCHCLHFALLPFFSSRPPCPHTLLASHTLYLSIYPFRTHSRKKTKKTAGAPGVRSPARRARGFPLHPRPVSQFWLGQLVLRSRLPQQQGKDRSTDRRAILVCVWYHRRSGRLHTAPPPASQRSITYTSASSRAEELVEPLAARCKLQKWWSAA